MTTAQIVPQDAYDITVVDAEALTELFRAVNARRAGDSGVLWFLSAGSTDDASPSEQLPGEASLRCAAYLPRGDPRWNAATTAQSGRPQDPGVTEAT